MLEDISLKKDHYLDVARKIMQRAKAQGASSAEVALSAGVGQSVGVRLGELENIEHNLDHSLSLTLYRGQKKGYASTSDISDSSIDRVIEAAMNIAKFTEEDQYSGLADPQDLAADTADLALYHYDPMSIDVAKSMLLECEAAAMAEDPRITNSDGATASSYFGVRVYANSNDFCKGYATSRFGLDCTLIAEENDQMQRDGSYTVARNRHDMWSVDRVAKDAAAQTVAHLGAEKLETTEVPVLFRYDAASSLIGHFLSAISGGALYRKQSFLLDSLGKQLFPEFITIIDDPFVVKALASSPFDAEGVQVQKRDLLKNGCLDGYILSSYSARRLGLKTTGNAGGTHNIFVSHQDKTFDDLVQQMGTGLIVTDLIGQGVNLMTGDYSRGANGFWVENGQIQFPVEEITIASNLKDMYQNIQAISNDIDDRSALKCGSMLINNMVVAGG